jgi:multicomponent Na+:H+ antiporter subunit G
MELVRLILIVFLLLGGLFFFLVGTIGLIRLPDVFSRMHATTKSDTLGAGLIILAAVLTLGLDWAVFKLLFILIFIWITNPTAAHIIGKAVYLQQKEEKVEGSNHD